MNSALPINSSRDDVILRAARSDHSRLSLLAGLLSPSTKNWSALERKLDVPAPVQEQTVAGPAIGFGKVLDQINPLIIARLVVGNAGRDEFSAAM